MGFLAVRAVVDVDVWSLVLFHSNTAEMQETQASPGSGPSTCPAQPLGQWATRTRWMGVEGWGKEGLP